MRLSIFSYFHFIVKRISPQVKLSAIRSVLWGQRARLLATTFAVEVTKRNNEQQIASSTHLTQLDTPARTPARR